MSLEIERKFLVRGDDWRGQAARSSTLRQGYLVNTGRCSVRLRLAGGKAWLSVKAIRTGPVREEYEYEVPPAEAAEMLMAFAAGLLIDKIRHEVPIGAHCFELDEFQGANSGLVEPFPHPPWLGDEATDDGRFHNLRLASQPFADWPPGVQDTTRSGRLDDGSPQ